MSDALFDRVGVNAIQMLGSKVDYISQTGVKTSVYALIDKNAEVYPPDFETGVSQRRTEISFISDDVPNIKHGERIVSGSDFYTVADVLEDDGFVVRVSVK